MALLLFLGLFSTVTNFLAGEKQRWKVMGSYVINLLIFLATNIGFYLILSMLMNISSPNDILSGNSVGITIKSPAWILFILLALCIIYVICAWKQLVFTIQNYRDMGATAFSIMFSGLVDKITGGLSALGDKFRKEDTGGCETYSGGTANGTMGTEVTSYSDNNDNEENVYEISAYDETSGYTDYSAIEFDRDDTMDALDIDSKIEKGKSYN